MIFYQSIVEVATLEWFGELGYVIGLGPHLAPCESAAERYSVGEALLAWRLREVTFAVMGDP